MQKNRQALAKGSILILDGKKYQILDLMSADGGSCLVYKAERLPSKNYPLPTKFVIKEFYPANLAQYISRGANDNLIADDRVLSRATEQKKQFKKGAEKQIAYFDDNKLNSSLGANQFINGSGISAYILSDFVGDFSLAEILRADLSLREIADIMVSLCNAVKDLHDVKRLHLDIKPSNIILFPKQIGVPRRIALFDFDTVVTDKNNLPAVGFYSKHWSPFEQQCWEIDNISEKTDIFSIGATFYWLLTGEKPNDEMITPFFRGDFSCFDSCAKLNGEKDDTNPAAIDIITRILSKTIADLENRYDNINVLLNELLSAIKHIDEPIYLLSHSVDADLDFIGRKEEVSKIDDVLTKHQWVNIVGMPGIGKTEIARRYTQINRSAFHTLQYSSMLKRKYHTVRLDVYLDSLKETIANYCFANESEWDGHGLNERFEIVMQRLEKTDQGTLLIIDNFDFDLTTKNGQEDELSKFKKEENSVLENLCHLNNGKGAKVIFTTRNRIYPNRITDHEVFVDYLSVENLIELFVKHCQQANNSECIDELKKEEGLLSTIESHTLLLVLSSGYLSKFNPITPERIRRVTQNLKSTAIKLEHDKNVVSYKDRSPLHSNIGTIYSHIQALIDLSNFNDVEKYVLRCLCLIPTNGISIKNFKKLACELFETDVYMLKMIKHIYKEEIVDFLTSDKVDEVLSKFEKLNLFISQNSKIHCHTLLSDVLFNELQPQMQGEDEVNFEGDIYAPAKEMSKVMSRVMEKMKIVSAVATLRDYDEEQTADLLITMTFTDWHQSFRQSGLQSIFAMNLINAMRSDSDLNLKKEVTQIIKNIATKFSVADWASDGNVYAAAFLLISAADFINYTKETFYILGKLLRRLPTIPMQLKEYVQRIMVISTVKDAQRMWDILSSMLMQSESLTLEYYKKDIEKQEEYSAFLESHARAYKNLAYEYETTYDEYSNAFVCYVIGLTIFNLKGIVELKKISIEAAASSTALEKAQHLTTIGNLLSKFSFKQTALSLYEHAHKLLDKNVEPTNSVLIDTKKGLVSLLATLKRYEEAEIRLKELNALNLNEISFLSIDYVAIALRGSYVLREKGLYDEAIKVLSERRSLCKDNTNHLLILDAMVTTYLKAGKYEEARQTLLYAIELFHQNKYFNSKYSCYYNYRLSKVNIKTGKICDTDETFLFDYLAHLSKQYLPVLPDVDSADIYTWLTHDAIIYTMDFDNYPDFEFLRSARKTDFVRRYNELCKQQMECNSFAKEHRYKMIDGSKQYSKKDVFKIAFDFWLMAYHPDDDDLMDTYDMIIEFYEKKHYLLEAQKYCAIRDNARISGKIIRELLEKRRVYFSDLFLK